MNKGPRLLAIGGAHIDRRGQLFVDYVPGASNPGVMHEEVGGGVFNAARNAVQMGLSVAFLSVRGGDVQGQTVAQAIRAARFDDLSATFLDRQTATYTAILDQNGDVITALADMEIYETALPRQIARRKTRDAIEVADAVLTDANMPSEAIERLLALASDKPVFAIAISPAKVVRFSGLLDKLHCLFLNSREAKALAGTSPDALRELSNAGLKRAVMTNGGASLFVLNNGEITQMNPPADRRIVDVTGAGDALAGVTTAGLMLGYGFHEALAQGMAAAAATVESREAVVDLKKCLPARTKQTRHETNSPELQKDTK
jgi:pseudouridine kinase